MTATAAERNRGLRRWAIAAAAAALPLGALAFTALNVVEAADTQSLAARQEAAAAQLERRVQTLGGRAVAARDVSALYLAGETPELARAELQRRLGEAVEAVSGRLIESQDPGDRGGAEAPADGRVELRITFDATNDGLLALLYGVETGLPLLTVERVEARKLDAGADGANPDDPSLRVGLVVRGHRKAPS